MAANRVQKRVVYLSGYDFEIKHWREVNKGRADSRSRINIELIDMSDFMKTIDNYTHLNYVNDFVRVVDSKAIAK